MPAKTKTTSALQKTLQAMDATGDAGFEGFVRDCLEEILGQRYRLMKSGPQGGADMVVESPANQLQVAVEGKRYGSSTSLPLDQLKLKIVAAAESQPGLDLWVLATTRRISATDLQALRTTGDAQGLAVAVIDAADGEDAPSALDLLAAAAPNTVARHFPDKSSVTAQLSHIRAETTYEERLARVLEPFRRNDTGFASARTAVSEWLIEALADEATARARLHSFAGLDADGSVHVPRLQVEAELDAWLDLRPSRPLAVLGDEGVGKTWSILGWWRSRSTTDPDRLPLTLIVAASAIAGVGDVSGPDLVARLLAERVPIRTEAFWRRRLDLWAAAEDFRPRVLLVLDGLNQRSEFLRWSQIVQPLFDKRWKGLFAAAVTCRAGWWRFDLKELPNVHPAFVKITVPPFSEPELDAVLDRHGLSRADFSPAMLRLLEIPRYCLLAIERRDALADSGDITIERLIYEDWRYRVRRLGSDLAPTEEEFRDFIADQGRRLRSAIDDTPPSLSRREMVEALDRDAGRGEPALRTAISEIVDGGWMEAVEGAPAKWRLKGDNVPFALGLALLNEVRTAGIGASDTLAAFIEPLRGTDRAVAILRHATTAALLDPSVPEPVFDLLLDDWFAQQNFGPVDVRTMASLAPVAPVRFLRFAERLWSGARAAIRDDGFLIDAVVRAARSSGFRAELHLRLRAWLGRYRCDPDCLPFSQRDDPVALNRFADACSSRAENWTACVARVGAAVPAMGEALATSAADQSDQRRLSAFAAGVLSFLPRAEFADCFVAWAAARAIDLDRGGESVHWTLRLNLVDAAAAETSLLAVARALIDDGDKTGVEAGRRLLDALATPFAAAMASALPRPSSTVHASRRWPTIAADGTVTLDHLPKDPALGEFSGLTEAAKRVECRLARAERDALAAAARRLDASKLLIGAMGRDTLDYDFEHTEPVLARWAPAELGAIVRRMYASARERSALEKAEDAEDALHALVRALPRYWPALGDVELAAMDGAIELKLPRGKVEGERADPWLHLQVPRLAGKSAREQIALLAGDQGGVNFFECDRGMFAAPITDDYGPLAELLAGSHRTDWLGYILNVDRRAMPVGYGPILDDYEASDETARFRALRILRSANDPVLLRRFVESGWSRETAKDLDEALDGSLLLAKARLTIDVAGFWDRIDPQVLGVVLEDRPDDEEALDHFADYVLAKIAAQSFPASAFERNSWVNLKEPMRLLAGSRRGADLVGALEALLALDSQHAFGFDSFPVTDALAALCLSRPADGARLWQSLWRPYLESSWTLGAYEAVPFEGDDPALAPLRGMVLEAAGSDTDLELVTSAALDGGHDAWLTAQVGALLAGHSAGEIAKGLTIARFMDPTPAAEDAWAQIDAIALEGWLGDLRARCRAHFDQAKGAAAWRDAFTAAATPDEALAGITLVHHTIDRRSFELCIREIEAKWDALAPAVKSLWIGRYEDLKAEAKKAADGRQKVFFMEEPPKATHRPWRC